MPPIAISVIPSRRPRSCTEKILSLSDGGKADRLEITFECSRGHGGDIGFVSELSASRKRSLATSAGQGSHGCPP